MSDNDHVDEWIERRWTGKIAEPVVHSFVALNLALITDFFSRFLNLFLLLFRSSPVNSSACDFSSFKSSTQRLFFSLSLTFVSCMISCHIATKLLCSVNDYGCHRLKQRIRRLAEVCIFPFSSAHFNFSSHFFSSFNFSLLSFVTVWTIVINYALSVR